MTLPTMIARSSRDYKYRFCLIALVFSAALILRTLSAGGVYYPLLDDSIQLINFQRSLNFAKLIESIGLFASRPLAGLTDLYFTGRFHDCLMIPALIFAVLHGLSGILFLRLFERKWHTGIAFCVFYALLPLGIEGVFWLSAAGRIVPGMLFCAITANLFEDYIREGGIWRIVLFPFSALLSYGFYEQILVLSFTLTMLQLLSHLKEKRAWFALLVFPMLAVYFIFTGMHAHGGAIGSRMSLVKPFTPWYMEYFLPNIVRQIGAVILKGGTLTLFRGFWRGLLCTFASFGGVLLLLILLFCGAVISWLIPHNKKTALPFPRWTVYLWGILLFLAPMSLYFVVENPWYSFRATVPSFLGAGLVIDALLQTILRRERIYAIVTGVLASVCLIAGVSEMHDYRTVGQYDDRIANAILSVDDTMQGRVGILCLEEFPTESNYSFNAHLASAGAYDWSLYGKLVAVGAQELPYTPIPLAVTKFSFYHGWNTSIKRIGGYDQIWFWDEDAGTVTQLTVTPAGTGEHDYNFTLPDGTPWGRVFEEGDYGYIDIY
ncbi:MAG: hypothetical protein E7604_08685 [Ruminococcaceae bacterium]|nr:hypothetical protein [Oscillospiraceae bacterium]